MSPRAPLQFTLFIPFSPHPWILSLKCTLPPHSHLEFTLFPLSPLRFTLFTTPHVHPIHTSPFRFTRWDFQNVAEVARAELNKFYLRNGRPH